MSEQVMSENEKRIRQIVYEHLTTDGREVRPGVFESWGVMRKEGLQLLLDMVDAKDAKITELQARVEELTEALHSFYSDRECGIGIHFEEECNCWEHELYLKHKSLLDKSPQSLLTRRKLEGEVIEASRGLLESYRNLSWLFIKEHMAGKAWHGEGCMPCKDANDAEKNVTTMLNKLEALDALDQGEGR